MATLVLMRHFIHGLRIRSRRRAGSARTSGSFVGTVAAAGCRSFTVHARIAILEGLSPKENREVPPLRYEVAAQLKQDFPDLEIILNGGIKTLEECEQHLQTFDGVMLGREAYHNPYLLAQVDSRLFGAADSGITRMDALLALKPYVEQHLREGGTLHHVSRHVLGLAQGFPGARRFRQLLSVDIHKVQDPLALLDQLPDRQLGPVVTGLPGPQLVTGAPAALAQVAGLGHAADADTGRRHGLARLGHSSGQGEEGGRQLGPGSGF